MTARYALAGNSAEHLNCLDLFLPDCVSQAGVLLDQAKRTRINLTLIPSPKEREAELLH
jgi:hypothetical protein